MRRFDFVIIGGGTAGVAAAIRADSLGAKTALIEQDAIGGTSLNLGCIPTKSLLMGAEMSDMSEGRLDFATAVKRAKQAIGTMRLQDYEWPLASLSRLTRMRGRARFSGARELTVGDEIITGDIILIASGSLPWIPPIAGIDEIDYLTDRDFLDLSKAPDSMLILGGGPVGLEFAQIFAHFGTEVTVVQRGSRILSEFEPEIADKVREYLEGDGINIRTGEAPKRVRWQGTDKELLVSLDGGAEVYRTQEILFAAGRVANTGGLGLREIGMELDDRGAILVDDELRTSVSHIYAAGDVRGGPMIENAAAKEGQVATENALAGCGHIIDYEAIPSCAFIHPPVARVGMTEEAAVRRRHQVESRVSSYTSVPRAIIAGDTRGIIKMVADKRTRRVLGCSIVGEEAGDIVHEAALAVKYRLTVDDLASLEHVYPTYSQANGLVAGMFTKKTSIDGRVRTLRPRAA